MHIILHFKSIYFLFSQIFVYPLRFYENRENSQTSRLRLKEESRNKVVVLDLIRTA